jgi:hypothetical protein
VLDYQKADCDLSHPRARRYQMGCQDTNEGRSSRSYPQHGASLCLHIPSDDYYMNMKIETGDISAQISADGMGMFSDPPPVLKGRRGSSIAGHAAADDVAWEAGDGDGEE